MKFKDFINPTTPQTMSLEYIENSLDLHDIEMEGEARANIERELNLGKENLNEALATCSARIYYYETKKNDMGEIYEYLEILMRKRESAFMREFRQSNGKLAYKEKEKDIDRLLTEDTEWFSLFLLSKRVELAQQEYASIVSAFEVQGKLLMSANKRDLFESQISNR